MKAARLTREVCEKLIACYIITSDETACIALMSGVCSVYAPSYKKRSIVNRFHQLRALDVKVTGASKWCYSADTTNLFQVTACEMMPHRFVVTK